MSKNPLLICVTLMMGTAMALAATEADEPSQPLGEATPWGKAVIEDNELHLHIDQWPTSDHLSIPRLNNPLVSLRLEGEKTRELSVDPEVQRWTIDLGGEPPRSGKGVVIIELEGPVHVADGPRLVQQDAEGGPVTLAAHDAMTHGETLRYEPQPHKNTLGYWLDTEDWAQWEVAITQPGRYRVIIQQGCGEGHGGSEAVLTIAGQKLTFNVEDTGHFQNFIEREIGYVTIREAGNHELAAKALRKATLAVMDLRMIKLEPVE
ncbi:MAG: hypothetical protein WD294_01905 [Phycisphaeraceae bacterium]